MRIGDEEVAALAEALTVNCTLKELDLRRNSIGAGGAAALAEALKVNRALTTLNLSENSIGVEGAAALAEALKSNCCLLYTSPSPRDQRGSRMPSSA